MSEANTTTTDLAVVHGLQEKTLLAMRKVEEVLERVGAPEISKLPVMTQTVIMAAGMRDLRQALTKEIVEAVFMPLQGSKLGFKTDKEYPWEVVRDCIMEGGLRGFRPINNEMNIIGGNFYGTKEGLDRKVREYPGLGNLEMIPGVPVLKEGGALVPFDATWLLDGREQHLSCDLVKEDEGVMKDRRIPVKVNNGQGADAILGKAERKMLARIYKKLTGQTIHVDDDIIDTTGEAVAADKRVQGTDGAAKALVDKHGSKGAAAAAPAAESKPAAAAPAKATREPGEEG